MAEEGAGVTWGYVGQGGASGGQQRGVGVSFGPALRFLVLGEGRFDWIEVRRVGRQAAQLAADASMRGRAILWTLRAQCSANVASGCAPT